jgi:hypothetical protein
MHEGEREGGNNFSAISWWEQVLFRWNDDDIHFELDQHANGFYSNSSMKQWFMMQVYMSPSLGHIILILSPPVFVTPQWWLPSGEAANTNFCPLRLYKQSRLNRSIASKEGT